ncbi:ATP-binding protein [Bacillus sp. FJAT-49732]|uniref:ATP-binding protein n=1 Tax=Lederbergia citrisecunda TaxID=2833583 RepID=A0A942TQN3_9BACI|nr:ATP-binding protein [Lederbergia citrisecunda]MBS4200302.1 ATP-binding protein [Lederbergia citrisecunda]
MDKRKADIIFKKYSLIPDDLDKATFNNYEPQNDLTKIAKEKCEWFANHFNDLTGYNSLLLQGSYGLGKSHLAFSITKRVRDLGKVVIFITMPELLNVLRGSYGNSEYKESDILTACKDADLLILDDLGAEYVKNDEGKESWAADRIFQIINSRIDKPNVFTTNLGSKELAYKYGTHGGRIVSRMMNGTRLIKFEGKDYRLKGW